MTNDSHLFRTREQLEAEKWQLNGNIFNKDAEQLLPLYEGKLTGISDHRAGTFENVSEVETAKGNERETSPEEKINPSTFVVPRYWVSRKDIAEENDKSPHPFWLSFHDVANPNNERTFIATIIPRVAVGNTLPICEFNSNITTVHELNLFANMTAFVFDYVARMKISSRHFNFFVVKQIPVLVPETYSQSCLWSADDQTIGKWIFPRILELTYTSWDLEPLALDCGFDSPPFRWDETRRFQLRCELDAAFFHLYLPAGTDGQWQPTTGETAEELAALKAAFPTPRDAVAYIMDTFPIVRRKDEKKYDGDYRTKRIILDTYDALATAARTATPYVSPLDPPPGDRRATHPEKESWL